MLRLALAGAFSLSPAHQPAVLGLVTFTEAKREMLDTLRRNPAAPAPVAAYDVPTLGAVQDWKTQMRAYDAAQIELGLVTPQQVQRRNEAVRVVPGRARVLAFA